ncbi:MAG: DUF192 domain-containing protein, partial [Leeuwenhoekiella sp.]
TFTKEGTLQISKKDSTNISIDIEIADTQFDTETGLMYRESMKQNQGMLFIFDEIRERSFYMKNTLFPLDIIYIDKDKNIASFAQNAQPLDESSLPSHAVIQYVLEVNAGLVKSWNLSVGDSLSWSEN